MVEEATPDVLAKVTAHVTKLSGVTPKVIVPNMQDTTEQLNLLLAGSNPPDLFQANWDVYKSTLMPLNDLLAEHGDALLRSIPETSWKYMTDADGNIMGIPRTAATSPYMTWVRQDILDQANLDVPKTVEELTAYMAAAQKINPDFKAGTRAWSGNKWEEPAMGFRCCFHWRYVR